jgi:hydroxymethylpyrimidine/phosphomethylpyrimidine kinase
VRALRTRLLPLATIVTPNAPEAGVLVGRPVMTLDGQRDAAVELVRLGAGAALVKGGHLEGPATDVLATAAGVVDLPAERIASRHTHGTGCTLAAAIAANLATGAGLRDAVERAKAYVTRCIRQAPGLGHGCGPLQHFPI